MLVVSDLKAKAKSKDKQKVLQLMQDICAVFKTIDKEDIQNLLEKGMTYSSFAYTNEYTNKRRSLINSLYNSSNKIALILHVKEMQLGAKEEQIAIIADENGNIQSIDYKPNGDYEIEDLYEYKRIIDKVSLYREQRELQGIRKILHEVINEITNKSDVQIMNAEQVQYILRKLSVITSEDVVNRYREYLEDISKANINVTQRSIIEIKQAYIGRSPESIAREEMVYHMRRAEITMTPNKDDDER